jgi:hypothetical protein
MLVVQLTAFLWGSYDLARRRLPPRAAAMVAGALLLFPPVLTPMAAVWKDAQMAGLLVAGFALATRGTRPHRIAGVFLIFLAAAVRDNAPAALPPICLVVAAGWFPARRRVVIAGLGAGMWLALTAASICGNRVVARVHEHAWSGSVAIFDLAGTLCRLGPMSDDDVRAALPHLPLRARRDLYTTMCRQYNPRVWFALSLNADSIFVEHPGADERTARNASWWRVVREHPGAWLAHRWAVMKELLGITDLGPWEPVCQTSALPFQLQRLHLDASLSAFQATLGHWFGAWWANTMWYRPWTYALLGLVLLIYAAARRDGLVLALLASGLLYEASYFLGASSPDFRYSHWMIACTCLGAAITFGRRLRLGLDSRRA